MDPLDAWRDLIERLLRDLAELPYADKDLRSHVVFDRARDRYLVVEVGWNGAERLHGIHAHVDLIDGRIWIQYDGTERGIANDLVEAGVPRDKIVLGYKPPRWRARSGFAA